MRVVIQRVSEANVAVNGSSVAAIAKGFLILIGVEAADTKDDVDWLVKKVVQLRVFNDENGLMNLDIKTDPSVGWRPGPGPSLKGKARRGGRFVPRGPSSI